MNKILKSVAFLATSMFVGLLVWAGVASAHIATTNCGGSITFKFVPKYYESHVEVPNVATLNPGGLTFTGNGTLTNVPPGTYTVTWTDGYSIQTVVVNECEQEPEPSVVPSITPTPTGVVVVTKVVNNQDLGTSTIENFPLFLDGNLVVSGEQSTTTIGVHVVTETNNENYTAAFSGDCDSLGNVNVSTSTIASCILTNTFIIPTSTPPTSTPECVENCEATTTPECIENCGGGGGNDTPPPSGGGGGGTSSGGSGFPAVILIPTSVQPSSTPPVSGSLQMPVEPEAPKQLPRTGIETKYLVNLAWLAMGLIIGIIIGGSKKKSE